VVRTAAQKKVGGFRKEFPHSGDTELWLRLAAEGAVGFVDAEQAFRRIHNTNMSWNYSVLARLQDQMAAFDSHFWEYGAGIRDAGRLQQVLGRTLGEAAFWGASHAFDQGDVAACREHLDFARSVCPELRSWRPWSGLRWKRLMGPKAWVCFGPWRTPSAGTGSRTPGPRNKSKGDRVVRATEHATALVESLS